MGHQVVKTFPLPPLLHGRFINYMARAADDWTKNGPWMLADDLVVSFYLNHSGVELFNVRTTLLERGNAGEEVAGMAGGLQDHHSTGIEETIEDECCGEEGKKDGPDCDANMRRYRKYYDRVVGVCEEILKDRGDEL
mmetsp:Transcript_57845/g.159698  ORF Transcript_57845/g.159698 Transcript_57845/m.159698 type:complete len:137 (+) Transcript_57845:51-461(+)